MPDASAAPARRVLQPDFDPVAVGRRVLLQQAGALSELSEALGPAFAEAVATIAGCTGRVICCGVGKSGHVGRKIAATLASTGTPAFFVHANEASHGDLGMIGAGDVVIALSKSGETRELADVIVHAKRLDIPLIAVTGQADSALGRAAAVVLLLPDSPESADELNAPTTSTTLQMALGDALAVALLERRGFSPNEFRLFHPGGTLGGMLRVAGDLMHTGAELPLVSPATPMGEALLVMTEKRFGCLGVVDAQGLLVGAITDGDLRRKMAGLLDHTAGEVMTPEPRSVSPDVLAAEVLRLMNAPPHPITVMFVVDQGRPAGIIHIHDLLRAGLA
jgi:arabinose-5-phosphate isomerase